MGGPTCEANEDALGVGGDGEGGGGGGSAEFLSQMVLTAVDAVLETTVAMRVWRGMPWLPSRRGQGYRITTRRYVGMGRPELEWPGRKAGKHARRDMHCLWVVI
jgi:hypothetical protein